MEFQFVCKLCNKKFPSGKSLGGHMRSHVDSRNFKVTEYKKNDAGKVAEFCEEQNGYGLRQDPKKSVDSKKICDRCGKEFQSLKALCGHLACHSEKDKRGLKSKKVKKSMDTSSFSSVSESNLNEQEQVAMCLMLLSKDTYANKANVESSDNSLRSSSSFIKETDLKKMEDSFVAAMEDSDSGYFLDQYDDSESDEELRNKSLKRANHQETMKAQNSKHDSKYGLSFYQKLKTDLKKKKTHVCPFCKRSFKTGQALGGHKRSHFIIPYIETHNTTPFIKPELPDLLDLNLPAPEAGENGISSHDQLFSW